MQRPLSGRQRVEPFGTRLVAPDWSRAPVVSPAGSGKSRARRRNDDSIKHSLLYLLQELVSLSAEGEIYPRFPLDIDAEHLEVETLRSAELLQAALHVPASRSPREKVQDSQGFLSCHRYRRWRSSRMRIGRPRSGVRTLRIGCLAGRCGALMSRARPEAYRAHMSEVALSTLLASFFGIVAEANGLVIGRPGGALAGLPSGRLPLVPLAPPFLPPFLPPFPGFSAPAGGAGGASAVLLP